MDQPQKAIAAARLALRRTHNGLRFAVSALSGICVVYELLLVWFLYDEAERQTVLDLDAFDYPVAKAFELPEHLNHLTFQGEVGNLRFSR